MNTRFGLIWLLGRALFHGNMLFEPRMKHGWNTDGLVGIGIGEPSRRNLYRIIHLCSIRAQSVAETGKVNHARALRLPLPPGAHTQRTGVRQQKAQNKAK